MEVLNINKSAQHPLQTREWAEFRHSWGNKTIITKYGLLVFSKIPFTKLVIGTFIKGPKPTKKMLLELKGIGKRENALFIKLEPNYVPVNDKEKKSFKALFKETGCVPGKTLFTPTSFWIDLTKPEEELLKSFHPKTRYNIRYAIKKGVSVKEDNSQKAFEKYLRLTRETSIRQNFYAHTEKYHRLMWKFLHTDLIAQGKEPIARLMVTEYQKEVLTTWIIFVWKNFLYYPYGAWSGKSQNLQPNSLMMWEAIRYGKKIGLKTFDLWGREPGKGFTRFKEGFNPKVVEFLGSWDLVINPALYWLYKAAEYLRWSFLKIPVKLGLSKPKF